MHPNSSIFLILTAVLSIGFARDKEGCSFLHQGCVYNINLMRDGDPDNVAGKVDPCEQNAATINLDRAQNDYSAKINDIEKSFTFLRDAHESRLKELEGTVRTLLGLDESRASSAESDGNVDKKAPSSLKLIDSNNKDLMNKLQVEFGKLRDELKRKGDELIDTRMKLNESNVMMHEAHLQVFRISKDLISAENQITMLKRERAVLKNHLKDKSYRLSVSSKKVTECTEISKSQKQRAIELFRSESTLKESLMTTEMILNETKVNFDRIKTKHWELKGRHDRLKTILKKREDELVQCYSAKTNTFCGFEDPNMCGFTDISGTSDFFDWTRGKGRTPSANTGPSKDHTCKGPNGHFMFIEASAKGRGNNAILFSPLYRGLKQQCVEFFYHMNGRHMGTLNVYAKAKGDVLQSAWRAYGNQGDVWTNARLAIPKELAMAGYQIAFEGITENGYQGDMAIDDVSVTDGPCPVDKSVVPVTISINSTAIIKKGKNFARKIRRKLRNKKRPKKQS